MQKNNEHTQENMNNVFSPQKNQKVLQNMCKN